MKYILTILICLSVAVHALTKHSIHEQSIQEHSITDNVSGESSQKWQLFLDPNGLFSIEYPSHWQVFSEGDFMQGYMVNISPTDGSGAITILVYLAANLPAEFTKKWLIDSFEIETPLSEIEQISHNDWQGYRQLFRGSDDNELRDWLVISAKRDQTYILINANDKVESMKLMKETYQKILMSLKIFDIKTRTETKSLNTSPKIKSP